MADRVILHIGPRKTGTTYIQHTLWGNAERLAAQGYWLPLESAQEHSEAASRGRRGWWSSGRPERAGELWTTLVEQVQTRPGAAVISTELFSGIHIHEVTEMLAAFSGIPVEMVFGVRSLSRSIPAEWQQWVRGRSTVAYDAWLSTLRDDPRHTFWKTQDPSRIINRWSALLPPERINALIVPTSLHQHRELWSRFAGAAGVDPTDCEMPTGGVNESLGLVQAELLRRVNEAVDPAFSNFDYRRRVRRNVTSAVLLGARDVRQVVLPPAHLDWVEERSTAFADALKASGVAVHGDLADLHVPPARVDDDPMTVTDQEVIDAAVATILGMADRTAELHKLVWELRQQAEVATGQDPPTS